MKSSSASSSSLGLASGGEHALCTTKMSYKVAARRMNTSTERKELQRTSNVDEFFVFASFCYSFDKNYMDKHGWNFCIT